MSDDSLMSEQEEKEAINKLRAMMASLRETGASLTNALMLNAAIVGDRLLDEYEGRAKVPENVGLLRPEHAALIPMAPHIPKFTRLDSRSSVPTTGETGRDVDAMVAAVRYDLGGDQMRPMVECDEERLRYLFANAGIPAPSEGSGTVTELHEALKRFGAHMSNCNALLLRLSDPPMRGECDCGFTAALHAEGSK